MEKRRLKQSCCQILGINRTKGKTLGQMLQGYSTEASLREIERRRGKLPWKS